MTTYTTYANETNPLLMGVDYDAFGDPMTMRELQDDGGHLTRVRLLTEPGYRYMDVSYVHGVRADGVPVQIRVGCPDLRKGKGSRPVMADMIAWAKQEQVFGKSIGLLDESIWSVLA